MKKNILTKTRRHGDEKGESQYILFRTTDRRRCLFLYEHVSTLNPHQSCPNYPVHFSFTLRAVAPVEFGSYQGEVSVTFFLDEGEGFFGDGYGEGEFA